MGHYLLGHEKNNKVYFLVGFSIDSHQEGVVWTTAEKDAMEFDTRLFAARYLSTYFGENPDVFLVSRDFPGEEEG